MLRTFATVLTALLQSEVSSAGTNLVFVKAGNYARNGETVGIAAGLGAAHTLIAADAAAIAQTVLRIRAVSPGISVRAFIANGDQRAFARVQGVAAELHGGRRDGQRRRRSARRSVRAVGSLRDAAHLYRLTLEF